MGYARFSRLKVRSAVKVSRALRQRRLLGKTYGRGSARLTSRGGRR